MAAHTSKLRTTTLLREACSDLRGTWRPMAGAMLVYTAVAAAVLVPMIDLLLRVLIAGRHGAAVADVDIARFFFTSLTGVLALLLLTGLSIAVLGVEQACLMSIGLAFAHGRVPRVREVLAYAASRSAPILGLALRLATRASILLLAPLIITGIVWWALLRRHDINYYLGVRPPEFWTAIALIGAAVLPCATAIIKKALDWLLVLPLVLFERVPPASSFAESARRMGGYRRAALRSLAAWVFVAVGFPVAAAGAIQALGRCIAPLFAGSMAGMLSFVAVMAVTGLVVAFVFSVLTGALFALICVHLYLAAVPGAVPALPPQLQRQFAVGNDHLQLRWPAVVVALALALPLAVVAAYRLMGNAWSERQVMVIAHRGASASAPENTLAAFHRAGIERADYVELDVQESADGVVVVAHDSDLMKVARVPLKIWSSTAAQLRAVDIGSYYGRQYADERVPTLAEALTACKGITKVNIELKDYGHNQQLEQRVVALVEAAGMEQQTVTMSLSRPMVAKMKQLRPRWTSGLLIAKGIGDVSRLPVDFLAVESRMAGSKLIRAAHAVGKPVYVWTVDDPQTMIGLMGVGADGLITNKPALAREIIAKHAALGPAERLFLFLMTLLDAVPAEALPTGGPSP